MPELPDLTIYAKNLRAQLLDKPIASVDVFNLSKVNAAPATWQQAFVGQTLTSIEREGKELFFTATNGKLFSVHLMLSGKFSLAPCLDIHTINAKVLALGFEDGQALVISDYQHKCRATLNPKKSDVPDALSEDFSFTYFHRLLRQQANLNIKALLIDQHMVRGIGNAYADEILWKANISPKSIAGKIPLDDVSELYDAIPWTLCDAIEQLTRLTPDAISGEERSFLRVHHPKKATTPEGEPILCEDVASKRTYFTAKQRLFI